MLSVLARCYDYTLIGLVARFVRPPHSGLPRPTLVPASPEEVVLPERIEPQLGEPDKEGIRPFRAPSPFPSPWKHSAEMHGRILGPSDARRAILVLHGSYDNEYTYGQWMGAAFARHGFQVVIPAAPCHLDRSPPDAFSGAAFFWNTELVVAGMAQWLAEIHGLVGWLRSRGIEQIGLMGYSLGSLVSGLAAALWPDLDFVVLLAPVGHHLHAIRKSRLAASCWPWMRKATPAERALLDRWAPLYRRPLVPNQLFLITQCDALQPTVLQRHWWETWGRPPFYEYSHGHMSVLFSRKLYRDLEAFAATRAAGAPASRRLGGN